MALAVVIALGAGWTTPLARADGDPASDVLAVQRIFLPQDANIPVNQQAELSSLVQQASRRGFQLRIATVASPADLGSITELWRQPQTYARFLGQELALVFHGTLLIVMPDGYGTQVLASSGDVTPPNLAGLPTPATALGTATIAAVQRLAAQAGYPLTAATTSTAATSHPVPMLPWLVFAAGCILMALAWTASVRARPLRQAPRAIKSPTGPGRPR